MPAGITEFATAYASLTAARKAADKMAEAADATSRQQHHTEILSQISNAYTALHAAQDERSHLLGRIRELESIENIKERYKLVSLGAPGVVAYAPKQPIPDEADHHLCANCLNTGKISYLNKTHHSPHYQAWECHPCGQKLSISTGTPQSRVIRGNRSGWVV